MEFTPRDTLPVAGWRGWGENRMQFSHHLRGRGFFKFDCLTPDVGRVGRPILPGIDTSRLAAGKPLRIGLQKVKVRGIALVGLIRRLLGVI